MSTVENGILGSFSGKIGPVVGAKWRGKQTMRTLPKYPKNRKFSDNQLAQQMKMKLISPFAMRLKNLLKYTFEAGPGHHGKSQAISYIMQSAIVGEYPNLSVDFSQVLIARGRAPKPVGYAARQENGKIIFSWEDNSKTGSASAQDNAIVVAYCAELNLAIYTDQAGKRGDKNAELDVSLFNGNKVHTWLAFVRKNGEVSDSVWCGEFEVEVSEAAGA
jgi:hypothetical protein